MVCTPELSLRGGRRPTWRPEREARGSALGVQSRSTQPDNRVLRRIRQPYATGCRGRRPLQGACGRRESPEICNCRRRSLSAATDAIGWYVFIGTLYELEVPSRDCTPRALPRASRSGRHVGLRPPRNDNSGAIIILMLACSVRRCSAGRGMPRLYNAQPETFRFYSPRLALFFSPEIWYDGRRRCSAWRMCLTILTGAAI